jgi:hypothetical protein
MITLRIKTSELPALIGVCGLRLISFEHATEGPTTFVTIDIDPSTGLYLMKEFGERVAEDRHFDELCDRVGGSQDQRIFDLMAEINKPFRNL